MSAVHFFDNWSYKDFLIILLVCIVAFGFFSLVRDAVESALNKALSDQLFRIEVEIQKLNSKLLDIERIGAELKWTETDSFAARLISTLDDIRSVVERTADRNQR